MYIHIGVCNVVMDLVLVCFVITMCKCCVLIGQ